MQEAAPCMVGSFLQVSPPTFDPHQDTKVNLNMILIDTATLELREFANSNERYAILSHTWGPTCDEVTYDEMITPQRSAATKAKPGYRKIERTCEIARSKYNLPYAWIDTCCINKDSSAILSEAINSMFR